MNIGEQAAKWGRHYKVALLQQKNGNKCAICNCEMLFEREFEKSPMFATIDHIVPVSKGGANRLTNLRLACFLCNNKRGNFYHLKMGGISAIESIKTPIGESIHKSVRNRLHLLFAEQ